MYVRKLAILPCIECSEMSRLRFGYIIQYKRHFWQKWNNVLDKDGKQLIVTERTANMAIDDLRKVNYVTRNSDEQKKIYIGSAYGRACFGSFGSQFNN